MSEKEVYTINGKKFHGTQELINEIERLNAKETVNSEVFKSSEIIAWVIIGVVASVGILGWAA